MKKFSIFAFGAGGKAICRASSAAPNGWWGGKQPAEQARQLQDGRKERRLCSILPVSVLEQEPAYEGWPHLETIVKIERTREIGDKATHETAYFLSDEEYPSARYYSMVARGHWGVENGLHWHLDVTFHEDDSRLRTGFGPRNLSTLRKLALNVLRRADDKLSLARRRKKCARNLGYLYTILNKNLK
ncbi:MAG: ISAs1 family transposase [Bacteroidales bacterium]|nr:ISAs1 family transposase [Bacteroidales bacterium]